MFLMLDCICLDFVRRPCPSFLVIEFVFRYMLLNHMIFFALMLGPWVSASFGSFPFSLFVCLFFFVMYESCMCLVPRSGNNFDSGLNFFFPLFPSFQG